ncbi:MAG: NADPH-dependent F420 reductase [Chloroflexi bacterium]|nr:NADPH-dependent F420 reductase [Chloroflexota bacterium]
MKIGIIGTGRMGSILGKLWAAQGHAIMFGSRSPERAQVFAREIAESTNRDVSGGSSAEAAAFGEVVLLAVLGYVAVETVQALGPLEGKVIIDCNNALGPDGQLFVGYTSSLAEQIAAAAPGAHVVKAYNSIFYGNLEKPVMEGHRAGAFYCGDDADAKAKVAQLSAEIGFEPIDTGPLSSARLLEPLAMVWMQIARLGGNPNFALALLREE